MMTSELWDAVGQSERVVAGTSVGAAGDLRVRQVFWREQGEPVLVDSCTWVWMFVLSNWEQGTSHVCWESVVSGTVSVVA